MEVPRHWRLKKQRYALVGETCPVCHAHLFPPRAVCPSCSSAKGVYPAQQEEPVMVFARQPAPVER